MCVSCRKHTIPRYYDAVTIITVGAHDICIITLGARQGYHQVVVRPEDQ